MTFEQWLTRVDEILQEELGLTSSDLVDFPSRSLYDSGVSPEAAAAECLVEWNDFPYEMLSPRLQEHY